MLTIIYDGISVASMRPESPEKTFSSQDVPHGTNSVYARAVSILSQQGVNVYAPQFTAGEKTSMVTARKPALSAVDILTNPMLSVLDQTQVLNPTAEEVSAEFAKKDPRGQPLYANEAAAQAALVDVRKTDLATAYVNERIRQYLDVPTLTDEWKAQFTTVQSE